MNGGSRAAQQDSFLVCEYECILCDNLLCCGKTPKKEGVHIYLWSIRLEGIQYMDKLFYYPKTGRVTVSHTWMKSKWFKHKKGSVVFER